MGGNCLCVTFSLYVWATCKRLEMITSGSSINMILQSSTRVFKDHVIVSHLTSYNSSSQFLNSDLKTLNISEML